MTADKKDVYYKRANKLLFVLCSVSLLFIFTGMTPLVQSLKQLALAAIAPTVKITSDTLTAANNLVFNINNIVKVNQENINLRKELLELNEKLIDYDKMLEENIRLKNLMSLQRIKTTGKIFADVITREPTQWYQWILINKGASDGITTDLPVVSMYKNSKICVFGRVLEVHENTSKVALMTNSLFSLPVQIKNKKIDCLASGLNSEYITLSYIPENAKIKVGDEILTNSLSDVFFKDIPVGKITEITKSNSGGYTNIMVMPYFQTERTNEVIVLIPKEVKND